VMQVRGVVNHSAEVFPVPQAQQCRLIRIFSDVLSNGSVLDALLFFTPRATCARTSPQAPFLLYSLAGHSLIKDSLSTVTASAATLYCRSLIAIVSGDSWLNVLGHWMGSIIRISRARFISRSLSWLMHGRPAKRHGSNNQRTLQSQEIPTTHQSLAATAVSSNPLARCSSIIISIYKQLIPVGNAKLTNHAMLAC